MADFTTVQVNELPPNPLALDNNFPHEAGEILSRAKISDLVELIRVGLTGAKYELKCLRSPKSQYITDNFDMTVGASQGLGKNLWLGWAICNGNNGTDNLDGQVLMGYGANHVTVGEFLGSATHTLTEAQLPTISPINGTSFKKSSGGGGVTGLTIADKGTGNYSPGELIKPFGGGQSHPIIQPSMVVLIIMKIV